MKIVNVVWEMWIGIGYIQFISIKVTVLQHSEIPGHIVADTYHYSIRTNTEVDVLKLLMSFVLSQGRLGFTPMLLESLSISGYNMSCNITI